MNTVYTPKLSDTEGVGVGVEEGVGVGVTSQTPDSEICPDDAVPSKSQRGSKSHGSCPKA
jgi:hypothetical protein